MDLNGLKSNFSFYSQQKAVTKLLDTESMEHSLKWAQFFLSVIFSLFQTNRKKVIML